MLAVGVNTDRTPGGLYIKREGTLVVNVEKILLCGRGFLELVPLGMTTPTKRDLGNS